MFIDLTTEQTALRDTLRSYSAGLVTPAERVALLTELTGARGQASVGPGLTPLVDLATGVNASGGGLPAAGPAPPRAARVIRRADERSGNPGGR